MQKKKAYLFLSFDLIELVVNRTQTTALTNNQSRYIKLVHDRTRLRKKAHTNSIKRTHWKKVNCTVTLYPLNTIIFENKRKKKLYSNVGVYKVHDFNENHSNE